MHLLETLKAVISFWLGKVHKYLEQSAIEVEGDMLQLLALLAATMT